MGGLTMPLYIACRGEIDDHRLFWATFDGKGQSPQFSPANLLDDRASQSSPALAVFHDKLYMAIRGPLDDQRLFWATLELRKNIPTNWSTPQVVSNSGSFCAPALAVFRDQLYLACRGIETDHRLFWAIFDENTDPPQFVFQPVLDDRASSDGPALAVFQDKLYMVMRGPTDDHRLFWATFDGTPPWSTPQPLADSGSEDGPALAVFQDKLYMFIRGLQGDQRLFFATFDGQGATPAWSAHTVMEGLFSNRQPAVAVFRNDCYIAHIGTAGEDINVGGEPKDGAKPSPPSLQVTVRYTTFDGQHAKFPETIAPIDSLTSPALAVFPARTRSVRRFLVARGFNPSEGVLQAGSGSLKELMEL
jgi:hypothetical protein